MRNVIEYVLKDQKIKDGYVEITGPYNSDSINYDSVYHNWLEEKKLWKKDSGRMYSHNIISFHKDELISPIDVLTIGKNFTNRFFPEHQCLICVHQDKDHLHCHIVTNTVSFIDGHKLHQTKKDLESQKLYTNELCKQMGLSVSEKGKHFDGSEIEIGNITAWEKDKYNLFISLGKKSFVADCAIAITEVASASLNKDDFITKMSEKGWSVIWKDNKKHITFQNQNGNKVRDSNISKTFNLNISKESLNAQFSRTNEQRESKQQLNFNADSIIEVTRSTRCNSRVAVRKLRDATSNARSRESTSRDVARKRQFAEQIRFENKKRMFDPSEREHNPKRRTKTHKEISR